MRERPKVIRTKQNIEQQNTPVMGVFLFLVGELWFIFERCYNIEVDLLKLNI